QYGIGVTFDNHRPETISAAILDAISRKDEILARIEAVTGELCWENEQRQFAEVVGSGEGQRCLVIAGKRIHRNDRISRMTRSLLEWGWDVSIAAYSEPF